MQRLFVEVILQLLISKANRGRNDFKLNGLQIARLVFRESAFTRVSGGFGDFLINFVVREKSFSSLEDLNVS